MKAIVDNQAKALICLGGNFAVALPDSDVTFPAMRELELSVHIATKLNRTHLLTGKETLLLPCLGRTERDEQSGHRQSVTVEDSMSMVHASSGKLKPASPLLRSEPAIVAGMAIAALPRTRVNWNELIADYDHIRDLIEKPFPDSMITTPAFANPVGFKCHYHRVIASGRPQAVKRCFRFFKARMRTCQCRATTCYV